MSLFIGIEIGGTKMQAAIGNINGDLLTVLSDQVHKKQGALGILKWLSNNVPKLIENSQSISEKIAAIGCGFGGPVHRHSGKVLKSNQISGWDDYQLKNWLEETFQLPAWVENDSDAATWGEYQKGFGRGSENFFYTNIGSGVGGGFIIKGSLYDSQGIGAGEFGHMLIPNPFPNHDDIAVEIESICSGWSIEQRLRKPGYIPKTSDLFKRVEGNVSSITTQDLGISALAGDPFALNEIDLVGRSIGIGLANVLCLTNVEKIAVGGGVAKMGNLLLEPIRQYTAKYYFLRKEGKYQIQQSELGDKIVLVGSILLAKQAYFSS